MPHDWRRQHAQAYTSAEKALAAVGRPVPAEETLRALTRSFAVRVPDYYRSLIAPDDPNDPIALQSLPDEAELLPLPSDIPDAVGDEAMSPVPGIVQKHGNRVILLVSNTCTMYCRFCFRRPVASGHAVDGLRDQLQQAFELIRQDTQLREVILSGGDPLTLDDRALEDVLHRLRAIPHLRLLRIHTRAPVTLPARVTPALVSVLRRHRPLHVVVHFNHPRELTPEARAGLHRLLDAGLPLLNQTVLLKGVNNSVDTLEALCYGLLEAGVTPYYLHHCDRTPGTGRFRTSIDEGLRLMQGLKARLPGHGLPRYVIDIPGGHGKINLESAAAQRLEDGSWQLTGLTGVSVHYTEPELAV